MNMHMAGVNDATERSITERLAEEEGARVDRVLLSGIFSHPFWSAVAAWIVSGYVWGDPAPLGPLVLWAFFNVACGVGALVFLRASRRYLDERHLLVGRIPLVSVAGLFIGLGWAVLPWAAWGDSTLTRLAVAQVGLAFCSSAVARHVLNSSAHRAMHWVVALSLSARFISAGFIESDVAILGFGIVLLAALVWIAAAAEAFVADHRHTQILRFRHEAMARELAASRDAAVAARLRAEYAARAKSDFLSNMSHELRTPLNGIVGFAELLRAGGPGALGPRQAAYAADIDAAGRRLLGLINDVLDLARIEAGMTRLDIEAIDLDEVVDSAIAAVRPLAEEPGVWIVREPRRSDVALRGDTARLRRILVALLSNAVKYSHSEGEVTVEVSRTGDGWVRVVVADQGVGMYPEQIPLAFEPFRQFDTPGARLRQGAGLGLPLASRLVRLHGGELRLESALGEGTRAILDLPLDPTKADPEAEPASRP